MTAASLEQAIPEGERLLLDTTALAAYLDATEATHELARHIIDGMVGPGRNPAIVSMITVMEILVRPLRSTPHGHHTILAFIRGQPNLTAVATRGAAVLATRRTDRGHRFRRPGRTPPDQRSRLGSQARGPRNQDPRLHPRRPPVVTTSVAVILMV
jgi:hypothetical protein